MSDNKQSSIKVVCTYIRSSGERCKGRATKGSTRCHTHQRELEIKQKTDEAHRPYTRYAKQFPPELLKRWEQAKNDPNILSLNDEISLMTFRIGELLSGQKRGESSELWAQLAKSYSELASAILDKDDDAISDKMQGMHDVIKEGVDDSNTWAEVQSLNESKRRLVETQRRTLIEAQQMVTVDRMMTLLGAVVQVIQRHVTDERTMAAVSADIRLLVDVQAGRPPRTSDGETAVARLASG